MATKAKKSKKMPNDAEIRAKAIKALDRVLAGRGLILIADGTSDDGIGHYRNINRDELICTILKMLFVVGLSPAHLIMADVLKNTKKS